MKIRLAALALGALFFLFPLNAKSQNLPITQFGGLNTDEHPLLLKNGQTPDSQNIRTDEPGGGFQARKGFAIASTNTCVDMWEFPVSNGTRWFICHSSVTNTLKAGQNVSNLNVLISTTASATAYTTVGSVLGDKFFWSNKFDGLSYWNGVTSTTANSSMKFDNLVTHVGRLWGSGVPGAERTIYVSALSDGTDFALAATPVDDDPTQFVVGGSNDEVISALYASFAGKIMWFKAHSFGAVSGYDRVDFDLHVYSDKVGTAYKDSIQDCAGYLRFLGPLRTVWEFDGASHIKISEPIDDLMATFNQGDANNRSRSWTTETDFDLGTNNLTANDIYSGDVALSSWTATDTTQANFAAGTSVDMDTTSFSGSVVLSTNDVDHLNNSFESGSGTDADNWTEGGVNSTAIRVVSEQGVTPADGSYMMRTYSESSVCFSCASFNYEFSVLDKNGQRIYASGLRSAGLNSWATQSFDLSAYRGRRIKIAIALGNFTQNKYGTVQSTDFFVCSGGSFTFRTYATYTPGAVTQSNLYTWLDFTENGRSTIGSGNFTSQAFDTAISSPAFISSSFTVTTNGNDISLNTQTSADGVTWDARQAWVNNSAPISASKRYFRYQVDISTNASSDGVPYFDDANFAARSTSGSWVGDSFSLGSVTQLGAFTKSDDLDGGQISYAVFLDSDSLKTILNGIPVPTTYISSQTVTNGSIPTLSTQAYAFIGSTFSITVATADPIINDVQFNWSEGSILRVASGFPSQRYWLGLALNSSTNNRMLVYDRNRQWQLDVGQNANAITNYNGNTYFSNGSGVFQAESGYSDNGSSIVSYYKTPTLAPGGVDIKSTFQKLYLTAERGSSTLATTFEVDGAATDYSLRSITLNSMGGIQNRKLPFPTSQIQKGRYINFTWSVTGTEFWRVLGGNLEFTPDVRPE